MKPILRRLAELEARAIRLAAPTSTPPVETYAEWVARQRVAAGDLDLDTLDPVIAERVRAAVAWWSAPVGVAGDIPPKETMAEYLAGQQLAGPVAGLA